MNSLNPFRVSASRIFLFILLAGYYLEFMTGVGIQYFVTLGIFFLLYAFFTKVNCLPKNSIFLGVFVILFLISFSFFYSFKNVIFYFSPIIAYLFLLVIQKEGIQSFFKFFFFYSLLIFFLGVYEYSFGEYIYVAKNNDIELSEELFSGSYSFLRVKSVFEGPLTLAQFSFYGLAFMYLNRAKLINFFPYIALAFLTFSRMAIGIAFVFLSLKFLITKKMKIKNIIAVPVVLFFLGILLFLFYPDEAFKRTLDVFDFSGSSTNLARMYFWTQAINLFLSYDMINILFGYNGYYNFLFSNNAESGWLTILVDNGLFGFFAYLIPVLLLLYKSLKQKKIDVFFTTSLLCLVNSTMTLYLGMMSGILYWLLIFYMFYLLKNKGGK